MRPAARHAETRTAPLPAARFRSAPGARNADGALESRGVFLRRRRRRASLAAALHFAGILSLNSIACASTASLTPAQTEFFENKIRPVLAGECYECHSARQVKGGLRLDWRDALLKGGNSGPAIVPGDAKNSLLITAITHARADLKMPEKGVKLDDAVIRDFIKWVNDGAPDPRTAPPAESAAAASTWDATLAARRTWWSFQPVTKPAVPTPKNAAWSRHPVDRFLLAKMEERGLQPASPADPRVLMRRLYFALTGLPPKPDEVERFVADPADLSDKLTLLTDRLLASPHFGERWARHWMDLVRYAETHGSEGDPEIREAWRYRDYLIRAFNADVPVDRLIREHIAGDLLPHPRLNRAEGLNESILGIASLRLNEHGFQPVDTLDDQVKTIENQIDVLSKAFQAQTVACARCHDHKFDPISQRDFYALYGVLASTRPAQVQVDTPELLTKNRDALAKLKGEIKTKLAEAWLAAGDDVPKKLQPGADTGDDLTQRVRELEKKLGEIESAARAKLTEQRRGADAASPSPRPSPQGRGGGGGRPVNGGSASKPPSASDSKKDGEVVSLSPRKSAGVRGNASSELSNAVALPHPIARWSFEGNARDSIGALHGELFGDANIRNGRLILNGADAYARTAPLVRDLKEKTLEAWVALADLDQRGGGVITVESANGSIFDSIVFAEKAPRKWVNGSNHFRRSKMLDGPDETAAPGELIHVAVVYRADNSIAVHRNGALYAEPYTPGGPESALHTFLAGDAHLLFGRRHTGGARAYLAGQIDEARLYDRALTAGEVAASFRAGPAGVGEAELIAVLTSEQRARREALKRELASAKQEVEARLKKTSMSNVLAEAAKDEAHPLHAWAKLGRVSDAEFGKAWEEFAVQQTPPADEGGVRTVWNLAAGDDTQWFRSGLQLPGIASSTGEFALEADGERIVTGIYPAGVYSHALSQKHGGLFTSPRFKVESDWISVRALGGGGAAVRLIVDNYPLGINSIFPKAALENHEPGWIRLDTNYRKGSWAYLEFGTVDDLTRPVAGKKKPEMSAGGRSFFGVERVVFHDRKEPPRETNAVTAWLLAGAAPKSAGELAARYGALLKEAVRAWRDNKLSEPQRALLDFAARRDLLPNTLGELPAVAPLVAEYRKREGEVPVPRRAPGVIETQAFDAPLMPRGDHTRSGDPVPRGYLQVLGSGEFFAKTDTRHGSSAPVPLTPTLSLGGREKPSAARSGSDAPSSATAGGSRLPLLKGEGRGEGEKHVRGSASGRLQLADAMASPTNPLTARVMVNRLWHQLFGRGLVPTVDNFGRLGDKPTHPELLDYLAVKFIEDGWSTKKMIRFLVTSRAWQMSSESSARAREVDPANELLSHFRVRRLEAEAIRDSLLAVSGELDATMFGRPVSIGDQRRRSIYLAVRRTAMSPFLEVFDAAKPFTTQGQRDVTNVPAQSLALLNDPFVIHCAGRWAKSVVAQTPGAMAEARVRRMFETALARPPSTVELEHARRYLAELTGEDAWRDFAQSLFNLKEFIYVR
jgi:hypothetical protein